MQIQLHFVDGHELLSGVMQMAFDLGLTNFRPLHFHLRLQRKVFEGLIPEVVMQKHAEGLVSMPAQQFQSPMKMRYLASNSAFSVAAINFPIRLVTSFF